MPSLFPGRPGSREEIAKQVGDGTDLPFWGDLAPAWRIQLNP